jgi:hypothetical protein
LPQGCYCDGSLEVPGSSLIDRYSFSPKAFPRHFHDFTFLSIRTLRIHGHTAAWCTQVAHQLPFLLDTRNRRLALTFNNSRYRHPVSTSSANPMSSLERTRIALISSSCGYDHKFSQSHESRPITKLFAQLQFPENAGHSRLSRLHNSLPHSSQPRK